MHVCTCTRACVHVHTCMCQTTTHLLNTQTHTHTHAHRATNTHTIHTPTHPHTRTHTTPTHPHTHTPRAAWEERVFSWTLGADYRYTCQQKPTHGHINKRRRREDINKDLIAALALVLVSKSRLMNTLIRRGVEKTLIKTWLQLSHLYLSDPDRCSGS